MNGPHFDGDLRSHVHRTTSEPAIALAIYDRLGPTRGPFHELYQPTLVGIAVNAFKIRGFEVVGIVQEWYITSSGQKNQA